MSRLAVEIECLVLDGVALDPAGAQRLARRTETALARLLGGRGISPETTGADLPAVKGPEMKPPAGASEARWAEELALALYRAIDRWV
ncbi:MAG TPA: hypothetical protein VGS20_08650 [Candidatus Acidoferrales bacterium]|nr:hypothetical protein [Candidatus Acidoferrales bacterium]